MRQYGGKTLVVILNRDLRNGFTPAINKLLNTLQILTGLSVGLTRLTNDNALHRLTGYISLQIIKELGCSNSRQPSCYNLQRVGDC